MGRASGPERKFADELEAQLVERVARATAAWPGVIVAERVFVCAITDRLHGDSPARALDAMQTDDLYLACGCAAGDRAALAGFEAHCGSTIARAIAATGASRAERADLEQIVRQRLLVAPADGGAPRIATYSARGSLRNWVRVVATREVARMLPRARREISARDEDLASVIAGEDNPEIGYLKRLYRDEFKRAFHAAVRALGDRERLVLQQHALDGLGIDQLANLHGVHRATAARWVQAAHGAVLAGIQRELIRRLRLSRSELASVIRLIQSQFDITMPRLLERSA
jgi:RNA polymerase sigma-70 factor, ECF subfamily